MEVVVTKDGRRSASHGRSIEPPHLNGWLEFSTNAGQNHAFAVLPITALAVSQDLLYTGQSSHLRVRNLKTSQTLSYLNVLESEAIHGITILKSNAASSLLLVWGGRSLRLLQHFSFATQSLNPSFENLGSLIRTEDWILAAQLRPSTESEHLEILLVTAHNALLVVRINLDEDASPDVSSSPKISTLSAATRVLLYAADISLVEDGRVLVAAGTAFGELIVWTVPATSASFNASSKNVVANVHSSFTAHDGSIFGTQICHTSSGLLIVTCSDDRTIRVWETSVVLKPDNARAVDSEGSMNSTNDTTNETPRLTCRARTWAHSSRVWRIIPLPNKYDSKANTVIQFLSLGEDATCQHWLLQDVQNVEEASMKIPAKLNLQANYSFHSGKNIWAACVSYDTNQVFTGGADGAVVSIEGFHRSHSGRETQSFDLHQVARLTGNAFAAAGEAFKSYAFVSNELLLATSHLGKVLTLDIGNDTKKAWQLVGQSDDLFSYSIIAACMLHELCFLGTSTGSVYLYDKQGFRKVLQMSRKIGNLFAHALNKSIALFVTEIGASTGHLYYTPGIITTFGNPVKLLLGIGHPQVMVVTAMLTVAQDKLQCVFLGSRSGNIAIYKIRPGKEMLDPVGPESCFQAHNHDAVTGLWWLEGGFLVSTGRDGRYLVHYISTDEEFSQLKLVHQGNLPLGSDIEGVTQRPSDGHLIFHGFRGTKFVAWDETDLNELLSVECGGAHRTWSFMSPSSSVIDKIAFAWTKAGKFNIYSSSEPSHRYEFRGGHGREIKACAVSPIGPYGKRLLATGAEDTDIRIFEISRAEESGHSPFWRCIRVVRKHNTGLQHLQWSMDGSYLFSSAGMEEFHIWKVSSVPSIEIGIVCESTYPLTCKGSDLRIMHFDVQGNSTTASDTSHDPQVFLIGMALSDSTLRICRYSAGSQSWQTLSTATYSTCCLTQLTFINREKNMEDPVRLITGGTDGYITLWAMLEEQCHRSQVAPGIMTIERSFSARVHQNTIKCIETMRLPDRSVQDGQLVSRRQQYLVITTGDDNAIAFTIIHLNAASTTGTALTQATTDGPYMSPRTAIISSAHAAAITGLIVVHSQFEDKRGQVTIGTSGPDQRLKLWHILLEHSATGVNQEMHSRGQWQLKTVESLGNVPTNVADTACLSLVPGNSAHAEKGDSPNQESQDGEARFSLVSALHVGAFGYEQPSMQANNRISAPHILVCGVGMELFKIEATSET